MQKKKIIWNSQDLVQAANYGSSIIKKTYGTILLLILINAMRDYCSNKFNSNNYDDFNSYMKEVRELLTYLSYETFQTPPPHKLENNLLFIEKEKKTWGPYWYE